MRDSIIIYRSFYESIKDLPKKNQADVWAAIMEFSFNFNEVELKGANKSLFCLIKPQLEANIKRYQNGSKSKQKTSKAEANDKQTPIKQVANKNKNNNLNPNKNPNDNNNSVFAEMLIADEIKLEALKMKHRSLKIDKSRLDEFNNQLLITEKVHESYREYCTHFSNWIARVPKESQQGGMVY